MKKTFFLWLVLIFTAGLFAVDGQTVNITENEENGLSDEISSSSRKPVYNKRLPSRAEFLLIPESLNDVVGMYDVEDGTYLGDLIIDDTLNPEYDLSTPINAVQGPDDNIYLSDQLSDAVFVFDSLGNFLYTYADTSDGLNNVRGIDFRDGNLFITSGDDYVMEFDGPHSFVGNFIDDGSDPFDILFLDDGRAILCDIYGSSDNVRLYDSSGSLLYEIFSVSFPEQVQRDPVLPGAFLNNSFSADLITDFDLDSTIVNTFSFSSGRGVYRLGNGNLLATNGDGVFELDSATGSIVEQENNGSCRFIELYSTVSSVGENNGNASGEIALTVNPNPFAEEMEITIRNSEGIKELNVYDLSGRCIKRFSISKSSDVITWDGRNDGGQKVSPGIYFIGVNKDIKEKVIKLR